MRILVVGANGRLGRRVVARALEVGHEVTAFARRADGLPADPALAVRVGAVAEWPAEVRAAVSGQDAVIAALGNPPWTARRRGPAAVASAVANLVVAMCAEGVRRIAVPVAWGAGGSRVAASPVLRVLAATVVRRDYRDYGAAERVLTTSELDWTLAYLGALTDRGAAGWRASTDIGGPRALGLSRSAAAEFLVSAVERDDLARRRVVLHGAAR
ncbi:MULTISPECIES: NAD(P)-binding oxidoreductase [Actinosynnema]|uniref:NAD(P)-dependent oxidoreductase n=1 Tax=Actinosynnema TaxID=40566 RepID=UPI0020A3930A|nr:NAD(P)-binding oxidoreductase [Actinosynnema pretiosum]MCP2094881.1 putative NADH-flavin reductase [Actinosynnema pretiosum]